MLLRSTRTGTQYACCRCSPSLSASVILGAHGSMAAPATSSGSGCASPSRAYSASSPRPLRIATSGGVSVRNWATSVSRGERVPSYTYVCPVRLPIFASVATNGFSSPSVHGPRTTSVLSSSVEQPVDTSAATASRQQARAERSSGRVVLMRSSSESPSACGRSGRA